MINSMKLKGTGLELAAYYYKQVENYYFKQASKFKEFVSGSTEPGAVQIFGSLCNYLVVREGSNLQLAQFYNMLNGFNPIGVKVCREHKIKGIDFTFSAPKSVSIAALVMKDSRITAAHSWAVLETMKEIEKLYAIGRPSPLEKEQTGQLAYSTVLDGFNREHEPHLHTHVCLFNMTRLKNGTFTALDMRPFFTSDFNKNFDALYKAKLNTRLNELGFAMTYEKDGNVRLDKISHELEFAFSQRQEQILKLEKEGKSHMAAWDKSRKEKNPKIDKAAITKEWEKTVEETEQKSEQLNKDDTEGLRKQWSREATYSIEAQQERDGRRGKLTETEMWQLAARRATETSAVVIRDVMIREYLKELARAGNYENISMEQLNKKLDYQIEIKNLLELPSGSVTTLDLVTAERHVMNYAKSARGQAICEDSKKMLSLYNRLQKNNNRRTPSEKQMIAVNKLLKSKHSIDALQGDAGSGKTTTLEAIKHVCDTKKIDIVGLAVAAVAAKHLKEETKIESKTIASYFNDPTRKRNSVVIVDEASMVGSRTLYRLVKDCQQKNNKLLLVGDVNQLASITAGNIFGRIVEHTENEMRLAHLDENFRQRKKVLIKAVMAARDGNMKESLDLLKSDNKVIEIEDDKDRTAKVAGQYNKDTLIITSTRKSKIELDAQIRADLKAAGELFGPQTLIRQYQTADGVPEKDEIELCLGEQITFTKNEYKRYDIRNGERATVKAVNGDIIAVSLEDGRNIDIDTKKYAYIDYGYSMTTYKSQGQTYDKVVINADTSVPALEDMRNQYVQITRARDDIQLYTDDFNFLQELSTIRNTKRDTLSLKISAEQAKLIEDNLSKIIEMERTNPEQGLIKTISTPIEQIGVRTVEQTDMKTVEQTGLEKPANVAREKLPEQARLQAEKIKAANEELNKTRAKRQLAAATIIKPTPAEPQKEKEHKHTRGISFGQ